MVQGTVVEEMATKLQNLVSPEEFEGRQLEHSSPGRQRNDQQTAMAGVLSGAETSRQRD